MKRREFLKYSSLAGILAFVEPTLSWAETNRSDLSFTRVALHEHLPRGQSASVYAADDGWPLRLIRVHRDPLPHKITPNTSELLGWAADHEASLLWLQDTVNWSNWREFNEVARMINLAGRASNRFWWLPEGWRDDLEPRAPKFTKVRFIGLDRMGSGSTIVLTGDPSGDVDLPGQGRRQVVARMDRYNSMGLELFANSEISALSGRLRIQHEVAKSAAFYAASFNNADEPRWETELRFALEEIQLDLASGAFVFEWQPTKEFLNVLESGMLYYCTEGERVQSQSFPFLESLPPLKVVYNETKSDDTQCLFLAESMQTNYRTSCGRKVVAQRLAGSRLKLYPRPHLKGGQLAGLGHTFAPDGPFQISVLSPSPTRRDYGLLLGGQSGEFISFGQSAKLIHKEGPSKLEGSSGFVDDSRLYKTAWASIKAEATFRSYPEQYPFYSQVGSGRTLDVAPFSISEPTDEQSFPIVPYANYRTTQVEKDSSELDIDGEWLAPIRKAKLERKGASVPEEVRDLVTTSGLLLRYSSENSLTMVFSEQGSRSFFDFKSDVQLALDSLASNQLLMVIHRPPTGNTSDSVIKVGGWEFSTELHQTDVVLVVKLTDAPLERLIRSTDKWVHHEALVGDLGSTKLKLDELLASSSDRPFWKKGWKGILYFGLDASLDGSGTPREIAALKPGINQARFQVHHLGIHFSQVTSDASGIGIGESNIFGAIQYTGQREDAREPDGPYRFWVSKFNLQFAYGEIDSQTYECNVKLELPELLGDNFANGLLPVVELKGAHVKVGGLDSYIFKTKVDQEWTFAHNSALEKVKLERVDFHVGGEPGASGRFSLKGILKSKRFPANSDILGFKELLFARLGVEYSFSSTEYKTRLVTSGMRIEGLSTRDSWLLKGFGITARDFISGADGPTNLTTLGYVKSELEVPDEGREDSFDYGFSFSHSLGDVGALMSSPQGYSLDGLVGWSPKGKWAYGIRLPLAAGGPKAIKIQGISTLTAERFTTSVRGSRFVLALDSSAFKLFGNTLPVSRAYLFGLNGKIGWYVFVPRAQLGAFKVHFAAIARNLAIAAGNPEELKSALQRVPENPEHIGLGNAGWAIHASLTVADQVDIEASWLDPNLRAATVIWGRFKATIGYRRISDGLGEFYSNVSLPEESRRLTLGVVEVRAPNLGLSIYTNRDFKFDIGFPRNLDFSASAELKFASFLGRGGFKFGWLSAQTAPDFWNGRAYGLVITFGVGLSVGRGEGWHWGPVQAWLTVSILGLLEGAIAWDTDFDPGNPIKFLNPDAFAFSGRLGAEVSVGGYVDLAVVKAELEGTLSGSTGIDYFDPGSTTLVFSATGKLKASATVETPAVKVGRRVIIPAFSKTYRYEKSVTKTWRHSVNESKLSLESPLRQIEFSEPEEEPLKLLCFPWVAHQQVTAAGNYNPSSVMPCLVISKSEFERLAIQIEKHSRALAAANALGLTAWRERLENRRDLELFSSYKEIQKFLSGTFKGLQIVTPTEDSFQSSDQYFLFPWHPLLEMTEVRDGGSMSIQFGPTGPIDGTIRKELAERFDSLYLSSTQEFRLRDEDHSISLTTMLFEDYFSFLFRELSERSDPTRVESVGGLASRILTSGSRVWRKTRPDRTYSIYDVGSSTSSGGAGEFNFLGQQRPLDGLSELSVHSASPWIETDVQLRAVDEWNTTGIPMNLDIESVELSQLSRLQKQICRLSRRLPIGDPQVYTLAALPDQVADQLLAIFGTNEASVEIESQQHPQSQGVSVRFKLERATRNDEDIDFSYYEIKALPNTDLGRLKLAQKGPIGSTVTMFLKTSAGYIQVSPNRATPVVRTNLSTLANPPEFLSGGSTTQVHWVAYDPTTPESFRDFVGVFVDCFTFNSGRYYIRFPDNVAPELGNEVILFISEPVGTGEHSKLRGYATDLLFPGDELKPTLRLSDSKFPESYHSITRPGEIEFKLNLNAGGGLEQRRLRAQYCLMEYTISSQLGTAIDRRALCPPVSPSRRSGDLWTYLIRMLPHHHFQIPKQEKISPYALVGQPVTLKVSARDQLGNRAPLQEHNSTVTIKYSDSLIDVAEWPGIQLQYELQAGQVLITAFFEYQNPVDLELEPWVKAILETVSWQLLDSKSKIGIRFFASDNHIQNLEIDQRKQLSDQIESILAGNIPERSLRISVPLPSTLPLEISPWRLEFHCERPAALLPANENAKYLKHSICRIPHQAEDAEALIRRLHTTFSNYEIGLAQQPATDDLYLIPEPRTKAGSVNVNVFTPRPFSRNRWSGDVILRGKSIQVKDADLERHIKRVFTTIENSLSIERFKIWRELEFKKVANAKAQMAEKYSKQLDQPLKRGDKDGLDTARAYYKEELLQDLAAGYGTEAILYGEVDWDNELFEGFIRATGTLKPTGVKSGPIIRADGRIEFSPSDTVPHFLGYLDVAPFLLGSGTTIPIEELKFRVDNIETEEFGWLKIRWRDDHADDEAFVTLKRGLQVPLPSRKYPSDSVTLSSEPTNDNPSDSLSERVQGWREWTVNAVATHPDIVEMQYKTVSTPLVKSSSFESAVVSLSLEFGDTAPESTSEFESFATKLELLAAPSFKWVAGELSDAESALPNQNYDVLQNWRIWPRYRVTRNSMFDESYQFTTEWMEPGPYSHLREVGAYIRLDGASRRVSQHLASLLSLFFDDGKYTVDRLNLQIKVSHLLSMTDEELSTEESPWETGSKTIIDPILFSPPSTIEPDELDAYCVQLGGSIEDWRTAEGPRNTGDLLFRLEFLPVDTDGSPVLILENVRIVWDDILWP